MGITLNNYAESSSTRMMKYLTGECQGSPSDYLVKHDVLVKGDVEIEYSFSHKSNHIIAHGYQKNGEGEGYDFSRPSCKCYS